MKNLILQLVLTFVVTWLVQLFSPWWSLVAVALVIAVLVQERPLLSFSVGFVAVGLVWLMAAFLMTRTEAHQVLPTKMGELFGGLGYTELLIASATIAGIMGGLGALTGTLGRRLVEKR